MFDIWHSIFLLHFCVNKSPYWSKTQRRKYKLWAHKNVNIFKKHFSLKCMFPSHGQGMGWVHCLWEEAGPVDTLHFSKGCPNKNHPKNPILLWWMNSVRTTCLGIKLVIHIELATWNSYFEHPVWVVYEYNNGWYVDWAMTDVIVLYQVQKYTHHCQYW